jgi:hypothetical protein
MALWKRCDLPFSKPGKQPPYHKTSEYGVESDPAADFGQGVVNG